jgi:peptide chain release factor 1
MCGARRGGVFEVVVLERRLRFVAFRVTGPGAEALFRDESGGHRWQRIPPNERRGRVHTSTITVAVLPEPHEEALVLRERDLEWKTSRGSGAGGQHRNKTESAVDLTHLPTKITVHCETERSQHENRRLALARLRARLRADKLATDRAGADASRRAQVGQGMRGDKRRTIRCQEGLVVDHETERTWELRAYERGDW